MLQTAEQYCCKCRGTVKASRVVTETQTGEAFLVLLKFLFGGHGDSLGGVPFRCELCGTKTRPNKIGIPVIFWSALMVTLLIAAILAAIRNW